MGQWTVKEAGSALRRMALALTIAAIVAMMMALAAGPALAITHSKTIVSSSGNIQKSLHENDQGGEPAGGGGAVVLHGSGGGDIDHLVVTPSGSKNGHSHDNVQH